MLVFARLKESIKKVIKSQKGDLVTWIIIAVMLGIITFGVVSAVSGSIKSTQQKVNEQINNAATFTY